MLCSAPDNGPHGVFRTDFYRQMSTGLCLAERAWDLQIEHRNKERCKRRFRRISWSIPTYPAPQWSLLPSPIALHLWFTALIRVFALLLIFGLGVTRGGAQDTLQILGSRTTPGPLLDPLPASLRDHSGNHLRSEGPRQAPFPLYHFSILLKWKSLYWSPAIMWASRISYKPILLNYMGVVLQYSPHSLEDTEGSWVSLHPVPSSSVLAGSRSPSIAFISALESVVPPYFF